MRGREGGMEGEEGCREGIYQQVLVQQSVLFEYGSIAESGLLLLLMRLGAGCSKQMLHCLSSLKCFNLKRFVDKHYSTSAKIAL